MSPADRPPRRTAVLAAAAVIGGCLLAVVAPSLSWVADQGVVRERLRFPSTTERSAGLDSGPVSTTSFNTLGVSVAAGSVPGPISVRWKGSAGWSEWRDLEVDEGHGPDPDSTEAAPPIASDDESVEVVTDPIWVGEATGYQVRLPAGSRPDADVLLVRPTGGRVNLDAPTAGAGTLNQPAIRSRAEWGARAPSAQIGEASELKMAVVHHSATANAYGPADVAGILRSLQAFHMAGRGWSDLGYNLVVDRFGRIWEGRDGSIDRLSVGAHSEGFNTANVGIMVLGDFSAASPTAESMRGVAEVIAWKFANYGVDPASSVDYTSNGSPTIPAGVTRNFPRVVRHRDVGSTACPGAALAAKIEELRALVALRYPEASSPAGVVDTAGGSRAILLRGWAIDPNTSASVEIHAYLDGVGHNLGPASDDRPDLAATFPRTGAAHGFSHVFEGQSPGLHRLCVFAINQGPGSNRLLRCSDVTVPTGAPTGMIDIAGLGPDGQLTVRGWSVDPDVRDPLETHVYVDGVGTNLGRTSEERGDLVGPFPLSGLGHGFSWTTQVSDAPHRVCVFAINEGPGTNALLGCRDLLPPRGAPIGNVERIEPGPDGTLDVGGWAVDPDVSSAIPIHLYVDGVGVDLGPTTVDRPDVAAQHPGYGPRHGFAASRSGLSPGGHEVCVFAIDVTGDPNRLLACRRVGTPSGPPIGWVDAIARSGRRVVVEGWAIDPDTAASTEIHVYVDGVGANAGWADDPRLDVGAAFAGYGAAHGFRWRSPTLPVGTHEVCVFALDALGSQPNSLLTCGSVTIE
ncbi:MAG: N-acetylmuramoyl-L-alanine amidase [Microthrixaceae bacterium]|nr:N-acetylmuramoyl-L-alanine amidase [Microthrixaceae bacterium]